MREHFKKVFDQEKQGQLDLSASSLVTRRDFFNLVRLLRDVLAETGRLRNIINRVQLEPTLVSRLGELDAGEELPDDHAVPAPRGFLAPLSRLWSAGPVQGHTSAELSKPSLASTGRPATRLVPKLTAASGITSDMVVVKRQVSSSLSAESSSSSAMPRPIERKSGKDATLLRSIFAGGNGLPGRTSADGWISVRGNTSAAPFGRQTMAAPLTQATDAVLDSFSRVTGDEDDYRPNLLERQLRPRGLSDSSIHSTFIAHANPITLTAANLARTSHSKIDDGDIRATLTTDTHRARDQLSRKISRQYLRAQSSSTASPPPSVIHTPTSASPVAVAVSKGLAPEPSPTLFGNISSWAASSLAPLSALEHNRLGSIQAISRVPSST